MRHAYLLVIIAVCGIGLYGVADDFRGSGMFTGLGMLAALAYLFCGMLNLLNYLNGPNLRAARGLALGANAALLVALVRIGSVDWFSVFAGAVLAAAAGLSYSPSIRRSSQAAHDSAT